MLGHFDIVYFADPRFTGGTSRAFANEVTSLERQGVNAGYCPVLGPLFKSPRGPHPAIQTHINRGQLVLLDPREATTAGLVVIHHPRLFEELAPEPFGLQTSQVVLVLHHPPYNGDGKPEYDLNRILANIHEMFGVEVTLAPVGPAVRSQLTLPLPDYALVWPLDWSNLLDFESWKLRPERPAKGNIVIGRHSRPQMNKWPAQREDAVLVYPDCPGISVRMLGAPEELKQAFSPIPSNWQLHEFSEHAVRDFLKDLDFYVYFHSADWVEAFGYCVLEAIATGVPAILPFHFQPLFGSAAIYAEPSEVETIVRELAADKDAYLEHVRKARIEVERRFSIEQFPERLSTLKTDWQTKQNLPPKVSKRRIVFMTSNGVGLGHLTRAMAIASHLPSDTEVAIFTLSQAFKLAEDAGYLTQFIPFHRLTGASVPDWNTALSKELSDFLSFFRPDTLVFDGNVPYSGLVSALNQWPGVKRVWVRRGLWSTTQNDTISREVHFDLVIEPEDFSARFDRGATTLSKVGCRVPPILASSPDDRLTRAQARQELGLDPQSNVVAMMLGAGTNFDFQRIRKRLLKDLTDRDDIDVLEIVPPFASQPDNEPNALHRQISLYPAFRYSNAFDAMISSAGYNSFHEAILGGIPTLFVANEAPEMDLQIIRARHAKQIGCAEMLRASDRIGILQTIDRLLDPKHRSEMCRRMACFHFDDGATAAARLIYEHSFSTRAVQGFLEQL